MKKSDYVTPVTSLPNAKQDQMPESLKYMTKADDLRAQKMGRFGGMM